MMRHGQIIVDAPCTLLTIYILALMAQQCCNNIIFLSKQHCIPLTTSRQTSKTGKYIVSN